MPELKQPEVKSQPGQKEDEAAAEEEEEEEVEAEAEAEAGEHVGPYRSATPEEIRAMLESLEKTKEFSRHPKNTSLWLHGGYPNVTCHAVCLTGLPRTLVRKKLTSAMRLNLLGPMSPCVDVFWVIEQNSEGHRPGISEGFELKTTYASLAGAMVDTNPVFIKEQRGGWRVKARACFAEARRREKLLNDLVAAAAAATSAGTKKRVFEYTWTYRIRPDFLFYKPIDLAIFKNEPRDKNWYYSNVMDFFEAFSLVPPDVAPTKARWPRAGTQLNLDVRICRPKGETQRRLDGFDIMWQNLLPIQPHPPSWLSLVPPKVRPSREFHGANPNLGKLDLLVRTVSIFCFRLDLLKYGLLGLGRPDIGGQPKAPAAAAAAAAFPPRLAGSRCRP
mmetsp:Transcript_28055/g.52396  ORF Transcript_28055/g.52396 Transcript_28055/m.52396 type:complete len:389 (-) Transcript_28055:406-1572(-)